MDIVVVSEKISRKEVTDIAKKGFGDMVKAVVDVEQGIIAIGGELHADEEVVLSGRHGSKREHLWGINIYPEKQGEEYIEFDSMINIKPQHDNRSRGVNDDTLRKKIFEIIKSTIVE